SVFAGGRLLRARPIARAIRRCHRQRRRACTSMASLFGSSGHSKSLQSDTAVHLQQAPVRAALAHRLKDFRRIATRYDRLARNYLASVCLAAALVWWI